MRNYIQHVKEKLLESIQSLESQKEMFGLVCLSLRHAKRLRKVDMYPVFWTPV